MTSAPALATGAFYFCIRLSFNFRTEKQFKICTIRKLYYLCKKKKVCHEMKSCQDGHLAGGLRNFERDGGRSTAYGVQAQFANHFVRLGGKLTGRERQLEG